jgi:hypothetical protein
LIKVLSVEEHMFLVEHVFRCGGEYTKDVRQFQAQFLETKVPHHNAVQQLIQKFQETGSMCYATKSGRPSILTEKTVGYLRPHASKSEEVHQEIIPAGWCLIWHGPYSF